MESETDGSNLICIGQGFATWQIVSHLLLLWTRHRQEFLAAHLHFMKTLHCFKSKVMMWSSWMSSVCWLCNHIEVECLKTHHDNPRAYKIIMWIFVPIEPLGRIWVISLSFFPIILSPIILLTAPAGDTGTDRQVWIIWSLRIAVLPDVLVIISLCVWIFWLLTIPCKFPRKFAPQFICLL